MCETVVDSNTVEVIGACASGEYDGLWFAEKDEHGNVIKESATRNIGRVNHSKTDTQ